MPPELNDQNVGSFNKVSTKPGNMRGGASALGPALQSVGVTSGYYLFNAAPYALTLAIIIATSSRDRALHGQPAELRMAK